MFAGCISLKSLKMSNFKTFNVSNMEHMFYKCKSITYLDISNFNFSSINNISYMFSECYNLKYINIKILIIKDDTTYEGIIDNIFDNPIICIDDEQSLNKILLLYNKIYQMTMTILAINVIKFVHVIIILMKINIFAQKILNVLKYIIN